MPPETTCTAFLLSCCLLGPLWVLVSWALVPLFHAKTTEQKEKHNKGIHVYDKSEVYPAIWLKCKFARESKDPSHTLGFITYPLCPTLFFCTVPNSSRNAIQGMAERILMQKSQPMFQKLCALHCRLLVCWIPYDYGFITISTPLLCHKI